MKFKVLLRSLFNQLQGYPWGRTAEWVGALTLSLLLAGGLWLGAYRLTAAPLVSHAAPQFQWQLNDEMPVYNWRVCSDLGIGSVPGVPGQVQRFRLCHNQGWMVLAYCLDAFIEPPPLGTVCVRIDVDTYWCGDDYQQLRVYQTLETPTPLPTETSTPSLTPTVSATATHTETATATVTAAFTATATNTASFTPTPSETSTPSPGITSTTPVGLRPENTPTPRAPSGGRGNGGIFAGLLGLAIFLTGAAWLVKSRQQKLARKV